MRPLLDNTFVAPKHGCGSRLLGSLAGSRALLRARRALLGCCPFLVLESEARDVVYLNWVLDAAVASRLAPPGIELWQRDGKTVLSVLTYRHGHLGPAGAAAIRGLFPSPLQSNWRLYVNRVEGLPRPVSTVLFIKTIMSGTLAAAATRVFSDTLPVHAALSFTHEHRAGLYTTDIRGGPGSAPELRCSARPAPERRLPESFGVFRDWEEAAGYLCRQDATLVWLEQEHRLAESQIALPIDLREVQPLQLVPGSFVCPVLQPLVGRQEPLCFVVPRVQLRVLSERLL